MATEANFSMFAGEDKILQVRMAPPVNITGWKFEYVCRQDLERLPLAIHKKSIVPGDILVRDAKNGIIWVRLRSADTASLRSSREGVAYEYDVQRVDRDHRTVLVYGIQTIKKPANPVIVT